MLTTCLQDLIDIIFFFFLLLHDIPCDEWLFWNFILFLLHGGFIIFGLEIQSKILFKLPREKKI